MFVKPTTALRLTVFGVEWYARCARLSPSTTSSGASGMGHMIASRFGGAGQRSEGAPNPKPHPSRLCCNPPVLSAAVEANRRLLRARDAMDRTYAEPLDVAALAR